MYRVMQKAMLSEVRLRLADVSGASTEIELVKAHARYEEALTILKALPGIFYRKDEKVQAELRVESTHNAEKIFEEVMIEKTA